MIVCVSGGTSSAPFALVAPVGKQLIIVSCIVIELDYTGVFSSSSCLLHGSLRVFINNVPSVFF